MPYIGTSPSNGVRRVFDYTATAGQTSFSGTDNNSQTLAYTDSAYIDVYQNGILLIPSDYTATTGTTVVLDTGATVSDTVQIVVYDVFSVADTVSASDGGSFGGNLGVGGTLSVTGVPTFTGRSVHSGGITIANDGQIGSVGDADAMAISSSGVVTFSQTPVGAGGLVKLLSATISSAVSEYDIDSTYINSTYDDYILQFNFKCATDNTTLRMRTIVGGTPQTGTIHAYEGASTSGSVYISSNAFDQYVMSVYGQGNATGESIFGRIHLQNVNDTTFPFFWSGFTMANNQHGNPEGSMFTGTLTPANVDKVVNGLRFFMASGNIASGAVKLYGIVK